MKEKLTVNVAVLLGRIKGAALGRLRTADYRVGFHSTSLFSKSRADPKTGEVQAPLEPDPDTPSLRTLVPPGR